MTKDHIETLRELVEKHRKSVNHLYNDSQAEFFEMSSESISAIKALVEEVEKQAARIKKLEDLLEEARDYIYHPTCPDLECDMNYRIEQALAKKEGE